MSKDIQRPKQTIVYSLLYAIEANDSLQDTESVLDHLRQYGHAEVIAVSVLNKPLEDVGAGDLPTLANAIPGKLSKCERK